jgi:hypothetical protein
MDVLTILIAIPMLFLAAATVYTIIRITRSRDLNSTEQIVWVLAVLCFPLVGMLVWFFAGPHPFGLRISRDLR